MGHVAEQRIPVPHGGSVRSQSNWFVLPLSMIKTIVKHGVGPSSGSWIVKKYGSSVARRNSLCSSMLWARRKSTAVQRYDSVGCCLFLFAVVVVDVV